MRLILTLFIFLSVQANLDAQITQLKVKNRNTKRFPFEVISARDAWSDQKNLNLRENDLISNNDIIKVKAKGHLIMIHYSGLFYEFTEDTIIRIDELASEISKNYILKKSNKRPNLKRLSQKKINHGMIHDWDQSTDILLFEGWFHTQSYFKDSMSICLNWKVLHEAKIENFRVVILNLFEEPIEEFTTPDNRFIIDLSKYTSEEFLVIRIEDVSRKHRNSNGLLLKKHSKTSINLIDCQSRNAAKLLQLAFLMESYFFLVNDAEWYFKKAAEISSLKLYDDMLDNYYHRNNLKQ